MDTDLRPAAFCNALLRALEASEGRSRKRKRDQTPDVLGLAIRRRLLECAVGDDPEPADFEAWLLDCSTREGCVGSPGGAYAMARAIFEEWRMAHRMPDFALWLERGAPSEDSDRSPKGQG
jgi:hypothetical protein